MVYYFLLLGIYLIGKIRFPKEVKIEKISGLRLFSAILAFGFLSFSIRLIYDKEKQSYNALSLLSGLATWLQLLFTKRLSQWLRLFQGFKSGIEFAKKMDKPILLDFTGYACVNCRKMEEHVWPLPRLTKCSATILFWSLYTLMIKNSCLKQKNYMLKELRNWVKKLDYGHKWAHFQAHILV